MWCVRGRWHWLAKNVEEWVLAGRIGLGGMVVNELEEWVAAVVWGG